MKNSNEQTPQRLKACYQRAAKLHKTIGNMRNVVLNATLTPHWINDHCFWYRRQTRVGDQFQLVDANAGTNQPAFNHQALASALSKAVGQSIDGKNLPITKVIISLSPWQMTFTAFDKFWCLYEDETLSSLEEDPSPSASFLVSPDGKKGVFVRDSNLWIRTLSSGEEHALTLDGESRFEYARPPQAWGLRFDALGLQARWSPDSKRLLTVQVDNRQVKTTPIINFVPQDGNIRPQLKETPQGFAGDEHIESNRILAIDVDSGKIQAANYRQLSTNRSAFGFFNDGLLWWGQDSHLAYFVETERGEKVARVVEFDTHTGATRILFEETTDTYFKLSLNKGDNAALCPLPKSNELIWFSDRNGWAHLYLYDLTTGELKHPITQGNWMVRQVLHFDTARRELWFQAAGRAENRDPYYMDICRVNIDTGELITVASTDTEYMVLSTRWLDHFFNCKLSWPDPISNDSGVSPSGDYVVTTCSRADQLPKSLLLGRDGQGLELEAAEDVGLPENWQWPEPVQLVAADNKTEIYGVVFRPADFSPEKCYPIIDCSLTFAEQGTVPKGSFSNTAYEGLWYLRPAVLAELGFIVVMIDGRGVPYRDKSYVDVSYGQYAAANLAEDRIGGIKQLAEKYPYMDLSRVGSMSLDAMPGTVYGMLEHPDFYKVGVSHGLSNPQLTGAIQTEYFEGRELNSEYGTRAEELVDNLRGKLLLMHGMNDAMSHPAGTFRLIEALRKANKDFDMLLLPNEGTDGEGGVHMACDYAHRRTWDYFVKYLQGVEPPKEFDIDVSRNDEH